MRNMTDHAELQRRVGQHLLGPLGDAMWLARRYRDVDAFHDYIGHRVRLVIPALVLIVVAGVACGMTPVMALVGANPIWAVAGLLLVPVMLIGNLFVLGLVFFSWLEERSLARTLRRRPLQPPRVPWLLATMFVALPFTMLLHFVPVVAAILLALLVAAPVAFALLDR